ncbi:MAG: hypothetical protein JNK02_09420 [Planctomycetes bacterium]|nr:hypothetical protein [Planctomycetota bacterium]
MSRTALWTVPGTLAALAAPLLAQSWPVHSENPELSILQDEAGNRTTAYQDLGRRQPAPTQHALISNWQSLGPFGGDMDDVQVSPADPNIVLAGLAPASGGGGGLFRSTDGGASWSAVASLNNISVHDIAFAPDGTAYAGTVDGVWRSVNGGATFTNLPLGIGLNDQVFDVDVDPTNAQVLWIGVADALGNQPVNVMVSTNGGSTWTNRTPPLAQPTSCSSIAIDPTNPQRVFAGFRGFGGGGQVWVTTNGGLNWTNRSAGLPGTPVNDLEHDGTRVYVAGGQLFGSQNFGFFSSVNDGLNWTQLHDGTWPNLVTHDIAIDPNAPSTVWVATAGRGLFRTTNGGTSWAFQVGGTGSLSLNSVAYAPGSSSTIFTGGSSVAVWRSTDGGASFGQSSVGIGALDVYSIDSSPLDPNEISIAFQGLNNGGVYTSVDAGATWSLAALPGTRYSHVRYAPQGVLYAISSGPTTVGAEGLYRRTGSSWAPIGPDQGTLFESELFGLRVSTSNPDFIVAVGADFGVAGFEPTVWRTTNGGASWTKVYEGAVANRPLRDVIALAFESNTQWLACYVDFNSGGVGGVLRSANSALTWAPSNTGLGAAMQCYSLSESTLLPGIYLANSAAAGAPGLYLSYDGGLSWTATGFVGQVFEVAAAAYDPSEVYIAQSGAVRVRASEDLGATFTPFDTGLPAGEFPRDLQHARAPGVSKLYFAGSKGSYATQLLFTPLSYCAGDGSAATCPCGPPSAPGTGCLNSFGTGGLLQASGANSVASDSLAFTASGLPPSTSALFYQGTAQQNFGQGSPFGDGLRCVAGTVIRLATKTAAGGVASYPGVGDPSVSVRGLLPPGGGTRYYQAWYRNAAAFCTPSTFNLTNGVQVSWAP